MPVIEVKRGSDGILSAAVPAKLRGRWCLILLRGGAESPPVWVSMQLAGGRFPGIWADLDLLPRRLGWIAGVQCLLPDAEALRFKLPDPHGSDTLPVRILPVGAALAAVLVALLRPRALLGALRHDRTQGVRGALALLTTPGIAPRTYAEWIALFDAWPEARRARLAARRTQAERPRILVAIWPSSPDDPALLAATVDSIAAQIAPSPFVLMAASGGGATAIGEGARAALAANRSRATGRRTGGIAVSPSAMETVKLCPARTEVLAASG